MYLGNPAAPEPTETAPVWSNAYRGVWHLGGPGDAMRDATANGADLTAAGGTQQIADGPLGSAVQLDGQTGVLQAPDGPQFLLPAVTLECWVKAAAQPDGAMLVTMPGLLVQAWFMDKVNPGVKTPSGWGGDSWVPQVKVLDSQWHHLALTYDGGSQRYYVDGDLVGTKVFGGGTLCDGTGPRFGASDEKAFFGGALAEARISAGARGADWIRASYESQRTAAAFASLRNDG
jgi:hypothetical protein